MPYDGEFAQYKPLRRLVESERVQKLLGSYRVQTNKELENALKTLNPLKIEPSDWTPKWIIGIDGSHAEVEVKNGFPGAEASYITIASVLLNIEKVIELDRQRPVNPVEFRKTETAQSIDCALPGCNVIADGESCAKDSLRKSIFEVFKSTQIFSNGESFLDTYEVLLAHKPLSTAKPQKCPYDEEDCPDKKDFLRNKGQYSCQCTLKRSLYSTDALRIHERMNPAGSNGAIFGEIMQVLERVLVVHILRAMESNNWLSTLGRVAIILDGPLAVFGQPAWISQSIYKEISRINAEVKKVTGGRDLLLVGVEKTGFFVDHFERLDRKETGEYGAFPNQSVGLVNDSYIKSNIDFSKSNKIYGDATYFGRKILYKTKSGARIVATLPFLSEHHKNTTTAEPSQYPRLSDAISLLDRIVSSRFPNAIVPLVSANAEAAIPLRLGNQVLEKLAKELMSEI